MKTLSLASLLVGGALAVAACGKTGDRQSAQQAGSKELSIAVIPKGTTHEYWRSIHAGAIKAAQELAKQGVKVNVIWKGPLREDDREQQIQTVEGFLSQGIQGLVLAPLDDRALVEPVVEAHRAGVPTVVIDSRLQTDSIVSFVATDNRKGGQLCADRMGELLGGKGNVLVLRYAEGSASTTEREEGFLDELKTKFPGITVVSSDQYAGATRETAKRASENLLNRYASNLQGIFTPNESATVGMLLALEEFNRAGKIHLVGFDASPIMIQKMRAGQLDGIAVQDPLKMGYLGVMTMVEHLTGKPVQRRIDTGVMMVTPQNLDTPAAQALVDPPVAQYLGGQ